jgi:hypothetical protein
MFIIPKEIPGTELLLTEETESLTRHFDVPTPAGFACKAAQQ